MRVCIVGGGTAGWMTAAALSKKLNPQQVSICLVESEAIGTVGVGEATLPHIRFFNQTLGINESEFMRKTQATFKLGIEFVDWGRKGQRYIHPFGDFGQALNEVDFYQYWLKLQADNCEVGELGDYAFGISAAKHNKFALPENGSSPLQRAYGYAYQFDSSLYAAFLRQYAQSKGVTRIEGKIVNTLLCENTGNVNQLHLDNGQQIDADFFVDCSGFRGLLIEQALSSGYQDWSTWLPCNRAVAIPCERTGEIGPYTRASAKDAGWMWRIPLQHRTGNGYVYWNEFISDQEAEDQLLAQLDGKAMAQPNKLFFKTGRRNHFWKNNVVAIGLSAGFLEPLESTSIHLIQEGITKLIELFPHSNANGCSIEALDVQEYNQQMALQYERVRDFLLLHYVANEKDDSPMWRYFREMSLPTSLETKLDAWLTRAYIQRYEIGAFLPPSWVAVLLGQNLVPKNWDPRANKVPLPEAKFYAQMMQKDIAKGVSQASLHSDFIKRYGASSL